VFRNNRGGLSIIGEEILNGKKKPRAKAKYTVEKGCRHEDYEREIVEHMFRSPRGF